MHYTEIVQKIFDETGVEVEVCLSQEEWDDRAYSSTAMLVIEGVIEGLSVYEKIEVLEKYFKFFPHIIYLGIHSCHSDSNMSFLNFFLKLESLEFNIDNLEELPKSIGSLTSLTNLGMIGRGLKAVPEFIGNLTALANLGIRGTRIKELPESIGNLTALASLSIDGTGIKKLPESIGNLTALANLDIGGTRIKELPESIGNLTALASLDIRGTDIKELPKSIGNLAALASLDISGTDIKELPKSIGNLTALVNLDVGYTSIRELPESIGSLTALTNLNIEETGVAELPESIGNLTALRDLNMDSTEIKELPESVGNLTALRHLYMGDIEIKELPESVGNLIALRCLAMGNTQVKELPESMGNLTALTELYMAGTQINELPECIGNLVALEGIDISKAQISELPECIGNLKNLRKIDLSRTKLTQIPPFIFSMKSIEKLNISYNEFESIPKDILNLNLPFLTDSDWTFSHDTGIFMQGLKLQEMDVNMFNKDLDHIREYYNELEKERVVLNETRVIFIGNGDAGKTTIINQLITGEFSNTSSATKGIYIEKHVFPITDNNNPSDITINFWDFGGQEIMHSMHEFFLGERCLYVIVLDGRRDEEPEKWLDLVKQYGKNSPVMVVMNKIDQDYSGELDVNKIRKDYGEFFSSINFNLISCKEDINFQEFKEDFLNMVKTSKTYKKVFPGRWNRVKQKLTDMKSEEQKQVNYIDEGTFKKYCEEVGIDNEYNQQILLSWLNDLGVCFSYKSKNYIGAVDEFKVLRPEWITNGIYKIITSSQIQNKNGFLSLSLIKEILDLEAGENAKYNNTERDFILGMMHDFELSYRVGNAEFMPMLTQKSEPDNIPINYDNTIHFKISYTELLPPAILYQFIVRMQRYVQRDYTWRRGVLLSDPHFHKCKALVQFGKTSKELDIYIEGDKNGSASFLSYICSQLYDVQKKISLDYKEYVMYKHHDGKVAPIYSQRMLNC